MIRAEIQAKVEVFVGGHLAYHRGAKHMPESFLMSIYFKHYILIVTKHEKVGAKTLYQLLVQTKQESLR